MVLAALQATVASKGIREYSDGACHKDQLDAR